jgi:hypothetical protein
MFNVPELAEAAGLTTQELMFWVQAGRARAEVPGIAAVTFSGDEARIVVRTAHLMRIGLTHEAAERAARSWADGLGAPLGGGLVVLALSAGDDEGAFAPLAHRAILDAERASWTRPIAVAGGGHQ